MRAIDPLLAAYLTFTTLLVITPGSTTAVIIRNTLAGGRAAGLAAAAGAAVGNSSHAAAAGLGLALLVARWPAMLSVLRVGGGAYLAWLGCSSLWRVLRQPEAGMRVLAEDAQARAHRASFVQGVTVNLLNPAIATFYLVVVPTFLPSGASGWYFAGLAGFHVALAFTCHGVWALGLDRLRALFHRPVARRVLEGLTGVALVLLALRILTGV